MERATLGDVDEYKFGSHGEADLNCSCSVPSFDAQIPIASNSQHVEERAHGSEIGAGAAADCGASGNACSNAHSNACSNAQSNAVLMIHFCLHVHHAPVLSKRLRQFFSVACDASLTGLLRDPAQAQTAAVSVWEACRRAKQGGSARPRQATSVPAVRPGQEMGLSASDSTLRAAMLGAKDELLASTKSLELILQKISLVETYLRQYMKF
eukprot:1159518-Pelagomonas_calceolata.AAC.7